MFFDQKNLGFTNLSAILQAFRTKVDIQIPLPKLLYHGINYVIEFENFIDHEMLRVYSLYEDKENKGIDIPSIENAYHKIGIFKII